MRRPRKKYEFVVNRVNLPVDTNRLNGDPTVLGDVPGSVNIAYGTKFDMPVVFYSQLMDVAFGCSASDAALDGQLIKSKELQAIADK